MIKVTLDDAAEESAVEQVIVRCFERLEELENKFSKFENLSDVSRLNRTEVGNEIPVSREFCELLPLLVKIWRSSQGAFDPFGVRLITAEDPITSEAMGYARKMFPCTLDLSGVAKGFVVDQLVQILSAGLSNHPNHRGVINAGGDLRFFGHSESHLAEIRLPQLPGQARQVKIAKSSLATSAFNEMRENPLSSTEYPRAPVYNEDHSISAIADSCVVADALTKVGWFAPPALALQVAKEYHAELLILNGRGEASR